MLVKVKDSISDIKKHIIINDIIILLIPLSIFSFYLYIYNPGILSYDSYNQLAQIYEHDFNNWHPFFHTFIEMVCLKIYNSPISIGVLQIITFSFMWTIICKYYRGDNRGVCPIFIAQVILTVFISVIPINAIYSITLWKDILYSYYLMFTCFLVDVILRDKDDNTTMIPVVTGGVFGFVWNLRYNGSYVIVVLCIILGIVLLVRNKKATLFKLLISTIVTVALISSLGFIYHVKDNSKDAVLAKLAHGLSYYYLNYDLSDEDAEVVTSLVTGDKIEEKFDIYISDAIWRNANSDNYNVDKAKYIKTFLRLSIKHPAGCCKYMLKSSSVVWDIVRKDEWKSIPYQTSIASSNNTMGIGHINYNRRRYILLDQYVTKVRDNVVADTLLNSPALYMYLSIAIIIFVRIKKKSRLAYYAYMPNLLNIVIVMLSTPVQDVRFLYSNLLVFYYLIIVLISNSGKKNG